MSTSSYFVYILASRHHDTIYIGITNDVRARLELHRSGRGSKFVHKYKIFRLVSCRSLRNTAGGDRAREAAQVLEAGLEDQADRGRNPDWNDRSGLI
ncbi:putative endonuclease [Bradyrhizobium sp. GM5.1]